MFVDRRCCAARHHSNRRRTAACELPAILIGRSPTTALDVPRGPSMFVDRVCCAASLGPSVDRSSASQHRRLGDVRGLGSSRFARGIGYVRRRRDVQDVCVRAPRDPHRSQSDRGPMSHGGRRCSSIAGAARRGITRTVARPQHGPQAAGRRCLRRWFEALGAGPRLVDRFVATRRTRSKAHHRESDMVAPHVGRSRERDRVQQCPDRGQCVTREDLR